MKNKTKDILYCNVSKDKIKSSTPTLNSKNIFHLFEWISERYNIHLKKDVENLPKPWTQNKILQKYRFCNVRREHDRESKWLIDNIIKNSEISYEDKMLNIILFRLINKSETVRLFGVLDFLNLDIEGIRVGLNSKKSAAPDYVYFSNAFFMSGPKAQANKLFKNEKNMVIKIIKLVEYYNDSNITDKIQLAKSQKEVCDLLLELPGIGQFLSYQIFVDFAYMEEFPFSENEFVVAGPGCKRGLNLIFKDFGCMNYEEAIFWMRDNQNKMFCELGYNPLELFRDLPKCDQYLNVMSLENCMCELSKYTRAINETGRPRVRYSGI